MTCPSTRRSSIGLLLYFLVASPPVRAWLESRMTTHMLVQIPLLISAGALVSSALPVRFRRWLVSFDAGGISFLLSAALGVAFWMLPRSLDAALDDTLFEVGKFISLPLVTGIPLALGWKRLSPTARVFIASNLVSMLVVLGWLYVTAPVRVCNFYGINEQIVLGRCMAGLAGLFVLVGIAWAFGVAPRRREGAKVRVWRLRTGAIGEIVNGSSARDAFGKV